MPPTTPNSHQRTTKTRSNRNRLGCYKYRYLYLISLKLKTKHIVIVIFVGYLSSQLLKISLPILSQNDCQERYNTKNTGITITDRQICAGGIQGKDSCSGDGGAPLGLTNAQGIFIQHGIVSFGSRYCGIENNRLPGVYTNVYSYIDWILDNIRA